jgi:hypothetical protein
MDATLSSGSSLPLLASLALALRADRLAAYTLGCERGAVTGHASPDEADFAWLAARGLWSLEGLADPQIGVDFEAGMHEGASLSAEEELEQAEPPARPGRPISAEEEAIALAI